ncbi:hypothetical protein CSUB01_12471, partial [Colletotrichum sublineola]
LRHFGALRFVLDLRNCTAARAPALRLYYDPRADEGCTPVQYKTRESTPGDHTAGSDPIQIRPVTPEGARGTIIHPFEPTPPVNAPGCAHSPQPSANDRFDRLTEDPPTAQEDHLHHATKRLRSAAPVPDFTAGSSAACLLSDNAPDPDSIVHATYPSKPLHRAASFQGRHLAKTSSAARVSKVGDGKGKKRKGKGNHQMTRASVRVSPGNVIEVRLAIGTVVPGASVAGTKAFSPYRCPATGYAFNEAGRLAVVKAFNNGCPSTNIGSSRRSPSKATSAPSLSSLTFSRLSKGRSNFFFATHSHPAFSSLFTNNPKIGFGSLRNKPSQSPERRHTPTMPESEEAPKATLILTLSGTLSEDREDWYRGVIEVLGEIYTRVHEREQYAVLYKLGATDSKRAPPAFQPFVLCLGHPRWVNELQYNLRGRKNIPHYIAEKELILLFNDLDSGLDPAHGVALVADPEDGSL